MRWLGQGMEPSERNFDIVTGSQNEASRQNYVALHALASFLEGWYSRNRRCPDGPGGLLDPQPLTSSCWSNTQLRRRSRVMSRQQRGVQN
jgi:hypothetical protein